LYFELRKVLRLRVRSAGHVKVVEFNDAAVCMTTKPALTDGGQSATLADTRNLISTGIAVVAGSFKEKCAFSPRSAASCFSKPFKKSTYVPTWF